MYPVECSIRLYGVDKIVIAFIAKQSYQVCGNINVDFCNKYVYLWGVAKLFCFSILKLRSLLLISFNRNKN